MTTVKLIGRLFQQIAGVQIYQRIFLTDNRYLILLTDVSTDNIRQYLPTNFVMDVVRRNLLIDFSTDDVRRYLPTTSHTPSVNFLTIE